MSSAEECAVVGCGKPAVKKASRSLLPFLQQLGFSVDAKTKSLWLCREHYNKAKKLRKAMLSPF